MSKKQGDPRSTFARAKLSLWELRYSKYIQFNQAEDEMIYYDYDMATQIFTRFEGV